MSFEFRGTFPKSPKRRHVEFEIKSYTFALCICRITERNFRFIVLTMPRCRERSYDDSVTNTFVKRDARYILFSPELMPGDWREAEAFASRWAHAIVRYIERGVRFHLSRASDEFAPDPDNFDSNDLFSGS